MCVGGVSCAPELFIMHVGVCRVHVAFVGCRRCLLPWVCLVLGGCVYCA